MRSAGKSLNGFTWLKHRVVVFVGGAPERRSRRPQRPASILSSISCATDSGISSLISSA